MARNSPHLQRPALFNGDAGSGPSNIRKYILENDWLDASRRDARRPVLQHRHRHLYLAHQQPEPPRWRGKVQLINASREEFSTQLRRNLGKKRYEISEDQSAAILGIYDAFEGAKRQQDFRHHRLWLHPGLRRTSAAAALQTSPRASSRRSGSHRRAQAQGRPGSTSSPTRSISWLKKHRGRTTRSSSPRSTKALMWEFPAGLMKTIRPRTEWRCENADIVKDDDGQPHARCRTARLRERAA